MTYYIKDEKDEGIQLFLGFFDEFLKELHQNFIKSIFLELAGKDNLVQFYFEVSCIQYKKVNSFLIDKEIKFESFDYGGMLGEKGIFGSVTREDEIELLLKDIWPYHRLLFLVEQLDRKDFEVQRSLFRQTVDNKNRELPKLLLSSYRTAILEFFHGHFLEIRTKKFSKKELLGYLKNVAQRINLSLDKGDYEDF